MSLVEQVHQFVSAKTVTLISNTSVFGGSGAAIAAWLSQQNILGLIGALIGIGGLVLNWWHKRAMHRIERERMDLEWKRYRDGRKD